jgi:hypothetical protein
MTASVRSWAPAGAAVICARNTSPTECFSDRGDNRLRLFRVRHVSYAVDDVHRGRIAETGCVRGRQKKRKILGDIEQIQQRYETIDLVVCTHPYIDRVGVEHASCRRRMDTGLPPRTLSLRRRRSRRGPSDKARTAGSSGGDNECSRARHPFHRPAAGCILSTDQGYHFASQT